MAGKGRSGTKRARLSAWIEEHRPESIDVETASRLARELAPISETYLRELLRECGVALDPLVEGVRQDSPAALESSLVALGRVYELSGAETKRACRELVIAAKDRARWSSKRASDAAHRAEKLQMVEQMLLWLENPSIFEAWAAARRARMSS